MLNQKVSEILRKIGEYLEIMGVDFKPRAYYRAAQSIESMSKSVGEIYTQRGVLGLEEIQGVGKNIAEKIEEIIKTGKCKKLEELKKKIPVQVDELMEIEGVGPKTIKLLYKELKITNIKELESAAKSGKIHIIKGMGEKTEQEILKGIGFYKSLMGPNKTNRSLLSEATIVTEEIEQELGKIKEISRFMVAGSFRRRKETIGDIDIICVSKSLKDSKIIMKKFISLPQVKSVIVSGDTKSSVKLNSSCNNMQLDLRVVEDKSYGAALNYFTGSKAHNIELRKIALKKGWKLSEYGLFENNKNNKNNKNQGKEELKLIAGKTEEELYKKLGLNYIEPELREMSGEIEASREDKLPKLVELEDIKGDLQMHSVYSDGINSIKEMAEEAIKLGYEYIAITDHVGLRIANSMSDKDIIKQTKEIERLNKEFKRKGMKFRIFKSAEVDINSNGDLNISTRSLDALDFVVASIHVGKQNIIARYEKAMQNPKVRIIAHPTGRLINQREGFDLDIIKLIELAKKNRKNKKSQSEQSSRVFFNLKLNNQTAAKLRGIRPNLRNQVYLEVNADPHRLDLRDMDVREAVKRGAKIVISTDAHVSMNLHNMKYGVYTARRGWATKKDVINALSLKEFEKVMLSEK